MDAASTDHQDEATRVVLQPGTITISDAAFRAAAIRATRRSRCADGAAVMIATSWISSPLPARERPGRPEGTIDKPSIQSAANLRITSIRDARL
jgi:hypothetical protein